MATNRTKNTVKHLRQRSLNAVAPINHGFNALAGGAQSSFTHNGARLSGFEVTDYIPGPPSGAGRLVCNVGAFIQADSSGDHRGLIAEERASIELTGATAGPGAGRLRLWGWVLNSDEGGGEMNAHYEVADYDTPPHAKAVPLAFTDNGDVVGSYHWTPEPGVSLLELDRRISEFVVAGGSARDFYFEAINYLELHPDYAFMAWQDFSSLTGEYGVWLPVSGDGPKFDLSNRQLKPAGPLPNQTQSTTLNPDSFIKDGAVYYELVGARCIWLERKYNGGILEPEPVYGANIEILDQDDIAIMSFTGIDDYDVDKTCNARNLDPVQTQLSIRITTSDPADGLFMRCIVLLKVQ